MLRSVGKNSFSELGRNERGALGTIGCGIRGTVRYNYRIYSARCDKQRREGRDFVVETPIDHCKQANFEPRDSCLKGRRTYYGAAFHWNLGTYLGKVLGKGWERQKCRDPE